MTETAAATVGRVELPDGGIEYEFRSATPHGTDLAPLVLLHEGLGCLELWRGFPAALHESTGRAVLVYSRHGYGRSAVVHEPRAVDYMHHEADEVLPRLLHELDVQRPILVGHSDGASIALLHAGRDDADVEALVLFAPHVIVEDVSIHGIEAARRAYLDTDLPRRLARYHDDPDATFWGWNDIWLSPEFRAWDITDRLPGVDVPVLAVQGTDDEYGTLRQVDLIEQGVTGDVQRVVLEHCRHAPHLDRPDATLAAVATFLARQR
ncbi:alpha/beta fold hydrolase [Egicoccus sp. AB-alg2]|uniref:alpha/beta fold hydrolase n=1 Tax=Egicoccus sp. AB-alg2 TaxID=3242693 RepID=UPI00359D4B9D